MLCSLLPHVKQAREFTMSNTIAVVGLITNLFDDKQLHIPSGSRVSVEPPKSNNYVDKPPFLMLGKGEKGKMYTAYPAIDTLLDLSKPEAWFMKMMFKFHRETTGISTIPYSKLTETEKRVLNKAYQLLLKRDFVRKVKLHDYMINPSALITNRFPEHLKVWEALDKPRLGKQPKSYQFISWLPEHFWLKSYSTWNAKTKSYLSK